MGRPPPLPLFPAPGGRQRGDLPAGRHPYGPGGARRARGHHQRAVRQPAPLHLPGLLPAGLQGQRQGLTPDHPRTRRPGPRGRGAGQLHGLGDSTRRGGTSLRGVLHPRRRGALPTGPHGGGGRVFHRDAPAPAAIGVVPFPRRFVQRPWPGRALRDGPRRAPDGRAFRGGGPHVQGPPAGGQQRTVLRDESGQGLPARVFHSERFAASHHLGRARGGPGSLGRSTTRVHA